MLLFKFSSYLDPLVGAKLVPPKEFQELKSFLVPAKIRVLPPIVLGTMKRYERPYRFGFKTGVNN